MEPIASAFKGNIQQAAVELTINGRSVTNAVHPYLNAVSFSEAVEGDSDSVEITLSDLNGKFRDAWYPPKGAPVTLALGYLNGLQLDCGRFELDEVEFSFPPSMVTMRAIAAKPSVPARTKSAQKFANTTLAQIVAKVAADLGLTVKGEIEHLQIQKMTQSTDSMQFLQGLLSDYGYAFNIRDNALNVYSRTYLNSQKPNLFLEPLDIKSLNFREKSVKIVEAAQVDYFDPDTEELKTFNDKGDGSSDSKIQNKRVENTEQAQKKAIAARQKQNADERTLSIELCGNPCVRAGLRFELSGLGRLNGIYAITRVRHDVSRSNGYTTSLEAQTSF